MTPRLAGRRLTGAVVAIAAAVLVPTLAACADDPPEADATLPPTDLVTTVAGPGGATTSTPSRATTAPSSTTPAPITAPATTVAAATTVGPTTTVDPALVARGFPIGADVETSYTPEAHANYRATDLFASSDCGTPLVSPVDGVVDDILPDVYHETVDDPATRGGNAVSILGDDGVRYYLAHFELVDPTLQVGVRVAVGQELGAMGDTGRAGACHLHFGLSLPCPGTTDDWWIRRGVIWPDQYLDAWKAGDNLAPLPELQAWFADYPDACRSVDDTPYPRA